MLLNGKKFKILENETKSKMENQVGKYIGTLLESRNQAHVFHLRTQSYAQHKALQKYYDNIVDLIDAYSETYQGMYGLIEGYKMTTPLYEDTTKIAAYFDSLLVFVRHMESKLPVDGALKNIHDEITTLISKTIYLLTLS